MKMPWKIIKMKSKRINYLALINRLKSKKLIIKHYKPFKAKRINYLAPITLFTYFTLLNRYIAIMELNRTRRNKIAIKL